MDSATKHKGFTGSGWAAVQFGGSVLLVIPLPTRAHALEGSNMPTMHWCNKTGAWFKSACPARDSTEGVQWSTFVNEQYYMDQPSNLEECDCSIKQRLEREPMKRRLP